MNRPLGLILSAIVLITSCSGGESSPEWSLAGGNLLSTPLPEQASAEPLSNDPAVAFPSPSLTGSGLDGEPMLIGVSEEGAVLQAIAFISSTCDACLDEAQSLMEIEGFGETGEPVLQIVLTGHENQDEREAAVEWISQFDLPGRVAVDSDEGIIRSAFGILAYPSYAYIAADQTVFARAVGPLLDAETFGALSEFLVETLSEPVPPLEEQ